MFRFLFVLSLIPCHFIAFALALPTLVNLTAESTHLDEPHEAEPKCFHHGRIQPRMPYLIDCNHALLAFPVSDYIGQWHQGADSSPWKLPSSSTHGSCRISVNLIQEFDLDWGSWDDVRASAATLMVACKWPRDPTFDGQRTGGWITSGYENKLRIDIARPTWDLEGAGNGTGVGTGQDTNTE